MRRRRENSRRENGRRENRMRENRRRGNRRRENRRRENRRRENRRRGNRRRETGSTENGSRTTMPQEWRSRTTVRKGSGRSVRLLPRLPRILKTRSQECRRERQSAENKIPRSVLEKNFWMTCLSRQNGRGTTT
jgi:hypothetical protein